MKLNVVSILLILICAQACADTSLKGTGSTLAGPLFLKWIQEYQAGQPSVKIQYEMKDSFGGVEKAFNRGADFTAVDTSFTVEEARNAQSRVILHLPVAVEGVAITYNLPGVPGGLHLTPKVLSDIFMGGIQKWNNAAIRELNPGLTLPDMKIRVIHREDESALHDLFPFFLAKLDPRWTLKREGERNLHWPAGQNVKGNDQVYEKMRIWPGVIAAVDLPFALQKGLPLAALQNEAGNFVAPSVESLAAAASDFQGLPEGFEVNLDASRASNAYPLVAFSYLLVRQDYFNAFHDHKKGKALLDFLNWILNEGQKTERDPSYSPLPEAFLPQVREKIKLINY